MRLVLHFCHLDEVVEALAVLSSGEGVVEAAHGVEAECHLLGLADEADGVEDFLLEAWAGVG